MDDDALMTSEIAAHESMHTRFLNKLKSTPCSTDAEYSRLALDLLALMREPTPEVEAVIWSCMCDENWYDLVHAMTSGVET